MMEYKGYTAHVEFDAEAGLLHGRVINTRDVITFQGTSVDEVRSAFADSVEDYLQFCASRNEEPEKPFSGKFLLRMEPDLHRAIASRAASDGLSINVWVAARLRECVTRPAVRMAADAEALLTGLRFDVATRVLSNDNLEGLTSQGASTPTRWGRAVSPDFAGVRVREAAPVQYRTRSQAGPSLVEAETYEA